MTWLRCLIQFFFRPFAGSELETERKQIDKFQKRGKIKVECITLYFLCSHFGV
jgi:hypothetical protein